jgi:nitroreductase
MQPTNLKDLVLANRSTRRFQAGQAVELATLRNLVDLARCAASARNLQPLRFILSCTPERNEIIFPCLTWPVFGAWSAPSAAERPAAYILILGDTRIHTAVGIDAGIATQTILLGAVERGLAGCIIGVVQHAPIRAAFAIPEEYRLLVVLALGAPAEKPVIDPQGERDPQDFYRDEAGNMHVCKRALSEVILDL